MTKEEKSVLESNKFWTGEDWCDHSCTSNCRRVGCNCGCGEFHGNDEVVQETIEYLKTNPK